MGRGLGEALSVSHQGVAPNPKPLVDSDIIPSTSWDVQIREKVAPGGKAAPQACFSFLQISEGSAPPLTIKDQAWYKSVNSNSKNGQSRHPNYKSSLMDEHQGHYTKQNSQSKMDRFPQYEVSKVIKIIETEVRRWLLGDRNCI